MILVFILFYAISSIRVAIDYVDWIDIIRQNHGISPDDVYRAASLRALGGFPDEVFNRWSRMVCTVAFFRIGCYIYISD